MRRISIGYLFAPVLPAPPHPLFVAPRSGRNRYSCWPFRQSSLKSDFGNLPCGAGDTPLLPLLIQKGRSDLYEVGGYQGKSGWIQKEEVDRTRVSVEVERADVRKGPGQGYPGITFKS